MNFLVLMSAVCLHAHSKTAAHSTSSVILQLAYVRIRVEHFVEVASQSRVSPDSKIDVEVQVPFEGDDRRTSYLSFDTTICPLSRQQTWGYLYTTSPTQEK